MFVCVEHQELWNRDTGCSYCRYRTMEQQLAELREAVDSVVITLERQQPEYCQVNPRTVVKCIAKLKEGGE